jgi:hypothetical protein
MKWLKDQTHRLKNFIHASGTKGRFNKVGDGDGADERSHTGILAFIYLGLGV